MHGQCDALLLAAGDLVDLACLHSLQTDQPDNIHDLGMNTLLGQLPDLQAVSNIVVNIVVWKQCVALKDHRGITLIRWNMVDKLVTNIDLAPSDLFKPGNHAERRCFAAAGWPEERYEFTGTDIHGDIINSTDHFTVLMTFIYLDKAAYFYTFRVVTAHLMPSL